jgi:cysteine synthase
LAVFVGAGTLMGGVARYFADHHPHIKVIAVDAAGSVTFAAPPSPACFPAWAPASAPRTPGGIPMRTVDDVFQLAAKMLISAHSGAELASMVEVVVRAELTPPPRSRSLEHWHYRGHQTGSG